MPILIPKVLSVRVKNAVFAKADAHGYHSKGRSENGQFMTALVDDPDVGAVLLEYMGKSEIKTYIKDGILNQYSKNKFRSILKNTQPTDTIKELYAETAQIFPIKGENNVIVCRSTSGKIFVVSNGTLSKWETALKKALELIARQSSLIIDGKYPEVCLQLAILSNGVTTGDKKLIIDALNAIDVKVKFCGG
jgi:hypothetical protein